MTTNKVEEKNIEPKHLTDKEIKSQYNSAKQKYSIFFQKALELEQELVEHNLVFETISKLSDDRRCFRKIGGVLVEKTVPKVKKDLQVEISNLKQTVDIVYKTMKQQEDKINQFEKEYTNIVKPQVKKNSNKEEEKNKKEISGVLV